MSSAKPLNKSEHCVHLDIATIKPGKDGKKITKPNWQIIVDAETQRKWTNFYLTKKGMIEPTCVLFNKWKEQGKPVTHLQMDNSGENMTLIERCKSAYWKLGIKKFELAGRETPQQNSLVEGCFSTIGNRTRSMLYYANIHLSQQHILFSKAAMTATLLDGLMILTINGVMATRFEHTHGNVPEFTKSMRTWGKAGLLKLKTKTTPNIFNKGAMCKFVGYPKNHAAGCWITYNSATKSKHAT